MDQTTNAFALDSDQSWRSSDQPAFLLRRAYQRASSALTTVLKEEELTASQYFALARLAEAGAVSQNRLGRMAAMDPATVQGVVRRLLDKTLVQRTPDPSDRRRMVLRLSPAGMELLQRIERKMPRVDESFLDPLSPQERGTFMALLERLA